MLPRAHVRKTPTSNGPRHAARELPAPTTRTSRARLRGRRRGFRRRARLHGVRSSRSACVLAVSVLFGAGCAGEDGATRLTIETERFDEERQDVVEVRFDLRCDPPGGSVPRPQEACDLVRSNPEMLDPPEMTATCFGSHGIPPNVSVRGVAEGTPVSVDVRDCDAPPARGDAAHLWLVAVGLRSRNVRQ